MDEIKKYFTLTESNSLILNNIEGYKAEIRIQKELFDNGIAILSGDNVITFAFLDIYVWESFDESKKLSDAIKILLRLPNVITTSPSRISYDDKNEEYILDYQAGDSIVVNTKTPKSSTVVVDFFNLVIKGKIPSDIPYNEISSYFEECARINNFNMKVNSLFVDLVITTVCRDPKNLSRQFREAIKDDPKMSLFDRKIVNMDDVPAITTQFNAISSGNPKYGITTSIGAIKSGEMNPEDDNISNYFE